MTPPELFALLTDMAFFARVVDAGNLSVAARQLGSTPSTAHHQPADQASQRRVGQTSARTHHAHPVRVTESGAQVVRFWRDIGSAASGAVDAEGQLASTPQGNVSVAAPTAFPRSVIHPLILGFLRAYLEVDPLADDIGLGYPPHRTSRAGLSRATPGGGTLAAWRIARLFVRAARRHSRAIFADTIASTLAKPPTTIAGVFAAARRRKLSR